ncbi:unnamed protein product [Heligmosomoides polygyrus]|uniref:Uncharacterized protein n=1 Tax=Heligmosomoides polygyrus TaxID=6339 RepID=A0A3P8CGF0_HELPZ|nr:unnamed protein product [Heligmosomoides polygyrus]
MRRRAEQLNTGHGHPMVDEDEVPEWARETAELERLDHGRIRAIFEKEDAESPREEGESSCGSDNMSSYLKYITLPEVRAFSGKEKDYTWETFLEAFALKYPGKAGPAKS